MRQRIIEAIIIIFLLLVVIGMGYWIISNNPQVWNQLLVELEIVKPEAESLSDIRNKLFHGAYLGSARG